MVPLGPDEQARRAFAHLLGQIVILGQMKEVVAAATLLLTDRAEYRRMAEAPSPYGDGHAAERIAEFIERLQQPVRPKKARRGLRV